MVLGNGTKIADTVKHFQSQTNLLYKNFTLTVFCRYFVRFSFHQNTTRTTQTLMAAKHHAHDFER